jgi:ElaB/YqjD/DUF883 family membrane-anchored ribosome-binding protein
MSSGGVEVSPASTEIEQGKAQEVVSKAQDRIEEKAGEMRGQAGERLRQQVDQRSNELGSHVDSFAHALRTSAEELERDERGAPARVARQVADRVERLGGYLQRSNSEQILADVERFSRSRPWLTGAMGAAMGFVTARFLKASSEGRYQSSRQSLRGADAPLRAERDAIEPPGASGPSGSR